MKKQVVAILGGKRDGNTHNLLKYLAKRLRQHSIDLEIINLNEQEIKDCKGCENCVLGNGCVIQDDMPQIMETMKNKDGIIIASPVYNNNISGKMKMFIDKTVKWAHSPVLTGKPYLGLSTTSSSGLKMTLSYLKVVGINWGAHPVGCIWASKRTTHMKQNNAILKRFVSLLTQDPKLHRPTLNQILKFQTKKVLAQTVFPNDYAYWENKQWLTMPYYYDCRINLCKRLMGSFFHWMFLKIMTRAVKDYTATLGTKEYGKLVYE